jgi:hypothetical protein
LELQLAETHDLLQEETRQKLSQQSKVRQLEADVISLREQKEEADENRESLDREIASLRTQVLY